MNDVCNKQQTRSYSHQTCFLFFSSTAHDTIKIILEIIIIIIIVKHSLNF